MPIIPEGMLDKIDKLIELETQKVALLKQLKRALMLAELIGIPPKQIEGSLSAAVSSFGTPLFARPWKTEEFVIRLGGEEVFRKKLIDVPLELWPDDIRTEYLRYQKRNKTPAQRKEETL